MKKIITFVEKCIDWIWQSSANPEKTSLTVKSVLLAGVPALMHAITISCGIGLVCVGVDTLALNHVVDVIGNVVMWILSAIAGIGFILGFVRKVWYTITGKIITSPDAGVGTA